MKLFQNNEITDKAAGSVADKLLKLQSVFASRMHKVSGRWTRQQQKIFLCIICVAFSTMSAIAIVTGFSNAEVVSVREVVKLPANVRHASDAVITEDEFRKVQRFRSKLDSAVMQLRPGLMDSIRMVEEMYYSNSK